MAPKDLAASEPRPTQPESVEAPAVRQRFSGNQPGSTTLHVHRRASIRTQGKRVGTRPRSSRQAPAPTLPQRPRSYLSWRPIPAAPEASTPHANRWIARFLAACCLGLVPWTIGLAFSLPRSYLTHNWPLAWVGFDVILLGCLGTTAWALWRRRLMAIPASLITAALLLCDAWFDVVTAHGGRCLLLSVATALLAEIPVALLLGVTSIRLLYASGIARRLGSSQPAPRMWTSESTHMRELSARKSCERSLPLRTRVAPQHA
jgi:hypothetical protein